MLPWRLAETTVQSRAVDPWLTRACDTLATSAGIDSAQLALGDGEAEVLIELARIAAHTSGDRRNAPLLCYLVGRARGHAELDPLADAVRRSTS